MLRSHIVTDDSEFSRLRPLWEELSSAAPQTMFQSFAWNATAAQVFGAREPLRVLVIESHAGAVILPACLSGGCLGLLGEKLFDYRDALYSDPALLPLAWEKLSKLGAPFELTALRGLRAANWEALLPEPFANAPVVLTKDISADDFLRTHNRLGRHSRRIRKHGMDLHHHSGTERELIRTIYERKGEQGHTESNLFSDPLRRDFMMEICAHPDTGCEVFTYETASELVAALVTFRDGNWRRFYTVYYDQRWASLSPGQVLLFEITAESLAQGLDCDFMTGEYSYKMRLATDSIPLYRARANALQLQEVARKYLAPAIAA